MKRITFLLLISISFAASAQNSVLLDNTGAFTKWKQIKTEHFKIIYQPEIRAKAMNLAAKMEKNYDAVTSSLDAKPKRTTVILQNEYAISNGFAALSPKRTELFTTTTQDYNFLGNNEWLDLLSVHEFRHLVQYESSKKGLTKLAFFVFGQNGQAGSSNIAAPNWYWEGDATMMETALTKSGRGRNPAFDMAFRANLLEGKRFNYHKQSLNSFKDFVPNHYVLGYHFTTHLRRKSKDPKIWGAVTSDAFKKSILPFTFSNALKKNTDQYVVDNYEEMMDELHTMWSDKIKNVELSEKTKLYEHPEDYVNYANPHPYKGGFVALKSGLSYIDQFVYVNESGAEKKLYVPGLMNKSGNFSLANDVVVWAEFNAHERWEKRKYSVIKSYNIATGQFKKITERENYSAPALNPNGQFIVAVKNLPNGNMTLVVLDAFNGQEIEVLPNHNNNTYLTPVFNQNGGAIVAIKLKDGKKSVVRFEKDLTEETELFEVGEENIGQPRLFGNVLYYNSNFSGIDNIYAFDLISKEHAQVTESKYGAFNAELDLENGLVYYNDYQVNGLESVYTTVDRSKWKKKSEIEDRGIHYIDPVAAQESQKAWLESDTTNLYKEKKYSLASRLLNVHSWGPFTNTNFNEVQLGIFSQDVMSQLWLYGGYTLNIDGTGKWEAKASYQGLYPVLDFRYSSGSRKETYELLEGTEEAAWDETELELGVRVPFNFTSSKYFTRLSLGSSWRTTEVSNYNIAYRPIDGLTNGNFVTNEFELLFSNLLKRSKRDINSRFGQVLYTSVQNSPTKGYTAGQFSIYGTLYFPGVAKNHSFNARLAFQHKKTKYDTLHVGDNSFIPIIEESTYWYANKIPVPRGYKNMRTFENFTTLQLNYALPIWNADVTIGPVLQIQRLRFNAFYDYGVGENIFGLPQIYKRRTTFSSVGGELMFDFNAMRFWPVLSMGVRTSYLMETNSVVAEFMLGAFPF